MNKHETSYCLKNNLSLGLNLYTCSHLKINILALKCLENKRSRTKDQEQKLYAEHCRREKLFHLLLPLRKLFLADIRIRLRILQRFMDSFILASYLLFSSTSGQELQ